MEWERNSSTLQRWINSHEIPSVENRKTYTSFPFSSRTLSSFDRAIDPNRLGLIGHSRGGGNSLLYAFEDTAIRSVVTWNGISDVDFFPPDLKKADANPWGSTDS